MTNEELEARVNHPSWYTKHPSGIECIDLIEHLPANLSLAVKYLWRCGLKESEKPIRELKSARWYTERERQRIELFELSDDELELKTGLVWRMLARKVVAVDPNTTLAGYLDALIYYDFSEMLMEIDAAIGVIENA